MTRTIAMIAALVSATVSVSSACIAQPSSDLIAPLKHAGSHVSPKLLAGVSAIGSELRAA